MRDPADPFRIETLTQDEARKRLWTLIDEAINRKAGLHEPRGRKDCADQQARYWRDQRRLREIARRVCHTQFETDECRSRFSDRLSRFDD